MLPHIQNIFCKHAFPGGWRGLRWGIVRACNVSCQHKDSRHAVQINMQWDSTKITHAMIHHSLSLVRKMQISNKQRCSMQRNAMWHNASESKCNTMHAWSFLPLCEQCFGIFWWVNHLHTVSCHTRMINRFVQFNCS